VSGLIDAGYSVVLVSVAAYSAAVVHRHRSLARSLPPPDPEPEAEEGGEWQ
jgi:hypothetical protein